MASAAPVEGVLLEREIVLSDRYHGFVFYVARILRPIWDATLFMPPVSASRARMGAPGPLPPPAGVSDWMPAPRWTESELRAVLAPLAALREIVRVRFR